MPKERQKKVKAAFVQNIKKRADNAGADSQCNKKGKTRNATHS